MSGGEVLETLPPAARGSFYKNRPWTPQKFFIRLKASIPNLHTNSNKLYDSRYLAAFSAGSVHLKKPSRWPKALIGPPCHGAPGPTAKAFD
jgi:hypothetical protein